MTPFPPNGALMCVIWNNKNEYGPLSACACCVILTTSTHSARRPCHDARSPPSIVRPEIWTMAASVLRLSGRKTKKGCGRRLYKTARSTQLYDRACFMALFVLLSLRWVVGVHMLVHMAPSSDAFADQDKIANQSSSVGGANSRSLVSAYFRISAYFLTAQTYKRMRLTTQVYGIAQKSFTHLIFVTQATGENFPMYGMCVTIVEFLRRFLLIWRLDWHALSLCFWLKSVALQITLNRLCSSVQL